MVDLTLLVKILVFVISFVVFLLSLILIILQRGKTISKIATFFFYGFSLYFLYTLLETLVLFNVFEASLNIELIIDMIRIVFLLTVIYAILNLRTTTKAYDHLLGKEKIEGKVEWKKY